MLLIMFARDNPIMAAILASIYLLNICALVMWCVWVRRRHVRAKRTNPLTEFENE